MGTLVETDIDKFIRGHKSKLQEERVTLTDRSRYPGGGPKAPSPRSRKQWDKQNGQATRPAVQQQGLPPGPEPTGLHVGDSVELNKKKQQLQQERQREYNELLAQRGPLGRGRRPPTPQEQGLPLGEYEKKRKALDQERGKEMREAMSKKAGTGKKLYDYEEAQKIHSEEKRKEYNDYLQKQKAHSRHVATPEEGMFVGPDQKERDRQIRERNIQNKLQLEKQKQSQLLRNAKVIAPGAQISPRRPAGNQDQQTSVQTQAHFHSQPSVQAQLQAQQAQNKAQQQSPVRPPLFLERETEGSPQRADNSYERGFDRGRPRERTITPNYTNETRLDLDLPADKYVSSDDRGHGQREVRQSRSYSPPANRLRLASPVDRPRTPNEVRLQRIMEVYDKKQQLLQDQYRREEEENQRRNQDQQPALNFNDNSNRRRLEEERSKEYQQYLAQKQQTSRGKRAEVLEGTGATLPVGEYDDRRRQQLAEERHNEYVQQQQQKLGTERRRGLPPKPPTPNHFFKNLGEHEKTQAALQDERKKEYNQKIAQERGRTGARNEQQADLASLPIKGHDSAELRKVKARNEEYNQFLQQKREREAHRFDHKKPATAAASDRHGLPVSPTGHSPRSIGPENLASLPGLGSSESAEARKIRQRNREYNEFLQQKGKKGPRKGWATPTYEEILDQKRREERRQDEEMSFGAPRLRAYGSEGAINKLEDDLRNKSLEKEFEARKVRFDDERKLKPGGILDDDNWLNPARREQEYQHLAVAEARTDPGRAVVEEAPDMAARVQQQPRGYLASLPVGGDERGSAKRRKQENYRRELRMQMEDNVAAKRREKVEGLTVNASGLLDPEKSIGRVRPFGDTGGPSPRREYKSRDVQPYHSKILNDDRDSIDDIGHARKPRGILSNIGETLQLERGRRRERDPGLLDPGFTGLLESRRNVGSIQPPPGLLYQPSFHEILDVPSANPLSGTYVTGGGGVGAPYSSIDEAYHFLGMKNPLDVADNGPSYSGGGFGGGGGGPVPSLNLGGDFGGGGGYRGGSPTPRVTFADDQPISYRKRDRSKERISPYQFPSDDDVRSKSRQDTQSYGAELERQIAEKRRQKMREKEEQERYERKLEEDIKNYNPFGRGGGGAPLKDNSGNTVADLRSLQKGGGGGESSRRMSPVSQQYSPRPPSPRDDKIRPPPAQNNALGEGTYARGGHGIFGHPKTEAEKDVSDKYKDELRLQIEEKRRRAAMEKQREKEEEDRENRRLEEQRLKMQSEYEEEQRKIRAREEEARKKNEELKQAADNRKKELERQKREQDEARMREQQEQIDRERQERQREAERAKSPPVPAMKVKTEGRLSNSPPLPAQRGDREQSAQSQSSRRAQPNPAPGPSQPRPNSSDVLTQLASMRKQLQSERRRVENALENSKNEPDVFDPRTIQRPPPNKLVFENAVNKNASLPPPRAQTTDMANTRNLQQFNELKFKSDSESRRAFRSMFPEAPITNNTLEAQQDAMIRQQEEMLRGLKERNQIDPSPASVNLGYGRHGNVSARSQLASNSAFIDVDGLNHFPEDFDDMAGPRNDSARARRRDRYSPRVPSVNGFGSQTSLDVDRIQRKNDERLRKLQQMTASRAQYGDDVSLTDPDDILDRFMSKQRYNRPPSGQTLQDDSWLRPGSKAL